MRIKTKIKKMGFSYQASQLLLQTIDFKTLLKNIPLNTADLILTDPPYSISKKTGFKNLGKRSVKRFAVSMDFGRWDKKEIDLNQLAQLSYKALRMGGTIICFYDSWKITKVYDAFIQAGFKILRQIIWEKTNPVPLNASSSYLNNARELAILGVKGGKPTFNTYYHNGVYRFPIHREKRIHPTQKPLKLMKVLINNHSKEGDLVIDPFLGSGSTAVASYQLNRRFIGGDKDCKYVKEAKIRIKNAKKTKNIQPPNPTIRGNWYRAS